MTLPRFNNKNVRVSQYTGKTADIQESRGRMSDRQTINEQGLLPYMTCRGRAPARLQKKCIRPL
jgi:hypothetical protein